MKKLFPLYILLLATTLSSAQSWKCFTPGVNQYFTNNYGYIRGMRIDSIVGSGANLIYHPYRTMRLLNDWYFDVTDSSGGSWLGKAVIAQPDGSFLFDNIYGDTIVLKSMANVGDSWTFYNDSTTDYYTATVTSEDTMSIMGTLDSIKRITLTAYQNGNYAPADSFDNTEIILTKSTGFFQVIDLYNFPYHEPDTLFSAIKTDFVFNRSLINPSYYLNHNHTFLNYNLPGNGVPGKYNSVFTRIDFTYPPTNKIGDDWNVGDVIHATHCFVSNIFCLQDPYLLISDTITMKTPVTNGYEYQFQGQSAYRISGNNFNISADSGTLSYPFYDSFHFALPEEIRPGMARSWFYYYFPDDTGYCRPGKLNHMIGTNIQYGQYTWGGLGWPSIHLLTFKEGLGLMREFHDTGDPLDGMMYDFTIKYIVHNGISCGTDFPPPLRIQNTPTTANDIRLYPNPAYVELVIEIPEPGYQLSILNTLGQVVYTQLLGNPKERVDISSFTNGIYYLRFETTDHNVINKKVIIQN